MEKVRVVIADDHSIVREGLKSILRKNEKYEVVAEADNGLSAVELAEKHCPNVVIMDLRMPMLNGFQAAQRIKKANPGINIFSLSANITNLAFQQGHEAGILGFMDKESVFTELYEAIDTVSEGSMYCCMRVRSLMGSSFKDIMNIEEGDGLSLQDRDLVRMLADGKSVGEIGLFLNKSPKTIDARRRKIMNQLGLDNLAELTKYAILRELTTAELCA